MTGFLDRDPARWTLTSMGGDATSHLSVHPFGRGKEEDTGTWGAANDCERTATLSRPRAAEDQGKHAASIQ